MLRVILLTVFMGVWGTATIVILIRQGQVPPEYWAIPAIGIGGILGAMQALDRTENRNRPPQDPNGSEEEAS